MEQNIQILIDLVTANENISAEEKATLISKLKDADKKITITEFKLERTEKVKHTTAILLEETIEELEQKRKAVEAQNKELEIEAALERVRAKTMAMQKQNDLSDVLQLLVEQLIKLGVQIDITNFSDGIPEGDWNLWIHVIADDGTIYNNYVHFPRIDHPYFTCIEKDIEIYKNGGGDLFKDAFSKEEKDSWLDYIYKQTIYSEIVPLEVRQYFYHKPGYLWSVLVLKDTWVSICRYTTTPFSDEEDALLRRFAQAFGLAYTRFLDLQKAEAQAREAQIELALERIRARTMAMQHSDELSETASLLFEQVQSFGVSLWSCGFNISEKGEKECTSIITRGGKMLPPVKLPLTENSSLQLIYEFREKGVDFWYEEMGSEEIKGLFSYIARQRNKNNPGDNQFITGVALPAFQIAHFVNFLHGNLMFITLEAHPEMHDIFKRFGKVFEQTYTRFLDLQNAEAQARESQIQLALERVRARTMAMQHSNELSEAATLLFKQISDLGIMLWSSAFQIWNADDISTTAWASAPDGSMQAPFRLPYDEDIFFKRIYEARQKGEEFFVMQSSGKELEDTYNYMFNLPGVKKYFDDAQDLGFQIPKYQITHCAFFSGGYLMFITYKQITESHNIFKRFAKVFEQTYTRFLDLQKAEAQAREAQIEASLERIRSRTMGMQRSNEILEVAGLLHKELLYLGIRQFAACGYIEVEEENNRQRSWLTNPDGNSVDAFYLPLTGERIFDERYNAWKRKETLFCQVVYAEDLKKHLDHAYTGFGSKESEEIGRNHFPDPTIFYNCNFSHGYLSLVTGTLLSKEEESLMVRFTRVFEQSYSRFLDLQKAEAQARESQIQLALERVRARTMAMQKSEELQDTAALLFQQVNSLGTTHWSCGFIIYDEDRKAATSWMASEFVNGIGSSFKVPMNEHIFKHIYEAAQSGESLYIQEIKDDKIEAHYKHMYELPVAGDRLKAFVASGGVLPTIQIAHAAFFTHGYLMFITQEPVPEMWDIFKRFGKVFEQTYTRFLDLQRAEAQARESQIQLALERVRAKTMAMHNSEDVTSATETMFEELKKLGLDNLRCGIANIHPNKTFDVFGVTNLAGGNTMSGFGLFGMDEHPVWQRWFESWKNKEEVFIAHLTGQEKEEYFHNINKHRNYLPQQIVDFPDNFFQAYYFEQGSVWAYSLLQHSKAEKDIMKRFATGFSLTFRRYQDLQKAEAQAREAQIELALEKVRARTMAMHNSNDVGETVATMFGEFVHLGIHTNRCGILIYNDQNVAEVWTAKATPEGNAKLIIGKLNLDAHKLLQVWL
jgi:hypothetical protein